MSAGAARRSSGPTSAMQAILLDVEGTTTPVEFVHEGLFSFARARLGDHLREHVDEAEVQDGVRELRDQREADERDGLDPPSWREDDVAQRLESATRYCLWLIAADRKVPALKALQGRVWEVGYLSGQLRGEVYPDVAGALARWHAGEMRIAIFSSGSVLSQRLLFAHSTDGDLSGAIDAYFDTRTGAKREPPSYRRIAAELGVDTAALLFVSDTREELDAAAAAGVRTALCDRAATAPRAGAHPVIASFDDLEAVLAQPPEPGMLV
ncbi:MAG TPA: acireductone synthase [Solirubrobacteraceae bacterium]|nr:acireductone synthase [Solirubrobacteraceae bacterium]